MEPLQGNHSVLEWNGSWGVIPFQDRMTPWESFRPRMEQIRESQSVLVKGILWSPSVLAQNDPMGVILSWDGTTPGEYLYAGIQRLQGSH